MGDPFRKMEGNSSTYSPKSSPHGGRSPIVSRQDSSGTLKTTISLGKTPTIIHTGPFYLMKEPPGRAELTGDMDLMTEYGLHHTVTKFKDKKIKESLASFLPNIPNVSDTMGKVENDKSTLRSIIENPPIVGKELRLLTPIQLAGFRLHPGPLPEEFRAMISTPMRKQKHKHKKQKHKEGIVVTETTVTDSTALETYEKKHKKQKRHEDDKERKKRKKEKKRKKKSHSPEPSYTSGVGSSGSAMSLSSGTFGLGGNLTPNSGTGSTLSSLTASLAAGSVLMPSMSAITPTLHSHAPHSSISTVLGSGSMASGFGSMQSNAGTSGISGCGSMSGFMGSGFSSSSGNVPSGSRVGSGQSNSGLLLSQHTSLF